MPAPTLATPVLAIQARARPTLPPLRQHSPTASLASRWSVSAWAFTREGRGPALATAGTLSGSQIGGRIAYRLNRDMARPLALVGRLYMPARQPGGAEAVVGVEWQPSARLPVRLLAERRQALGGDGRSAFALIAHGGISDAAVPGGLKLDGYGQAGVIGAASRDLFADGALRLSLPLGRLRVGAGVWGAEQPGVARLDLGPQAAFRLPLGDGTVAVAVDWRLRVAGDARPGSGPSLTLSTDF